MTWETFLLWLVALAATARLTHLAVDDTLTEPLRVWLRRGTGVRRFFGRVTECTWCTSVWAAGIVATTGYFAGHTAAFRVPALVLALSWLASVAEIWLGDPTPLVREHKATLTHHLGVIHTDVRLLTDEPASDASNPS